MCFSLVNTCKKLVEHGDKAYLEGDEEVSYVYYMKFCNLFSVVRQMAKTPKDKALIRNEKMDKQLVVIVDKLEELSASLEKRYNHLKYLEHSYAPSMTPTKPNVIISESSGLRQPDDTTVAPLNGLSLEEKRYFTIKELYTKMTERSLDMLILDCRPQTEFLESRINYPYCLNIDEKIIVPGLSAGKLQMMLSAEDRQLFTMRSVKNFVVLMDWDSGGKELIAGTPIYALNSALEFDLDVQCQNVMFLSGGYKDYLLKYPTTCSNPSFTRDEPEPEDDTMLDKIEYQKIEDIPMKDVSFMAPGGVPQVNRSTKTAAVLLYEGKRPNLEEVLEKEENLVDKTLVMEKEILDTENDYRMTRMKVDAVTDEKLIEENESKRQELHFKLLQLNNNRNDIQNELEMMQNIHKDLVAEEPLDPDQMEMENEKNRLIRDKEEEASRMAKLREEMASVREKEQHSKLIYAREQKKRLKSTANGGEQTPPYNTSLPARPEIPKIDRSAKPIQLNFSFSDLNHNIQRNFSPIYGCPARGLTGLKNLGNTCYMNSIVQCLSNTNRLTEYLVTGSYQKHINTSSKTQGKIALEMAAVVNALWTGQYKSIASSDLRVGLVFIFCSNFIKVFIILYLFLVSYSIALVNFNDRFGAPNNRTAMNS